MLFDIITVFPNIFDSYLNESFLKRAREKKLISIRAHNLRDFASDEHHKARPERQGYRGGRVDDRPFGGGPGMVVKVEPVYRAIQFIGSSTSLRKLNFRKRIILFSTRGKKLDAKTAKQLAKYDQLILICGRYEGVDERVATHIADEEISVGDFVLSGGELPALILMESVCRFIPGFLGKRESLEEFKGSYPVYTRPAEFVPKKGAKPWRVPKVLLSGHHEKINAHRRG